MIVLWVANRMLIQYPTSGFRSSGTWSCVNG